MGSDKTHEWGLRAFVTRPVQRHTVSPDWNTPSSYFSGAAISSRHVPWANGELYVFQLNEGNNLQKRDLSTVGFRVFAQPAQEQLDYEIESIYQVGTVVTLRIVITERWAIVLVQIGHFGLSTCLTIHRVIPIRKRILISCSQSVGLNTDQAEFWELFSHQIFFPLLDFAQLLSLILLLN